MLFEKRRELRMRRIKDEDINLNRQTLINMFSMSHDPYLSAIFQCPYEPIKLFIDEQRKKTGKKITFNHLLNKMFAIMAIKIPNMNLQILDGKVYEILDINITNTFKLPGSEGQLSTIVIERPHLKTLEQIHDDFISETQQMIERTCDKAVARQVKMAKVLVKSRLIRLIGERRSFKNIYEGGIATNIGMTNLAYEGGTSFLFTRLATNFLKAMFRIVVQSATKIPAIKDGRLVNKEIVPITVMFDHRFFDGPHLQTFGELIMEIANNPAPYMLSEVWDKGWVPGQPRKVV